MKTLLRAALCSLTFLAATAEAGDKYAVKAGTIVTMNGESIENGVIVMEGGRITAVGSEADVKIPWDAEVLDVPDLVAMPGFVQAHATGGMDRSNETIDVAPFLQISDSIDPVAFFFEECIRWGVTTINVQHSTNCVIGAVGMVVKPHGMTVDAMLVKPRSGVKVCVSPKSGKSRATQMQILRKTFGDLKRYLDGVIQQKKDGDDTARREALYQGRELDGEKAKGRAMKGEGWKVDGLELVPRGEIDEKQEPLLAMVEGELAVYINCSVPMDVPHAIELARDNGFLSSTVLVLGSSCWKAADAIKAAGVSVVLNSTLVHIERDPVSGEEKETFVPGVFEEKGIPFALSPVDNTTRGLWYQAAVCVGHGMTRAEALAAVTTTPAEILGLTGRVGQLAKGADANVVLFSGDPLSVTSFVEYVLIDGKLAYDRSKDVRTKYLLEGITPENTASAAELDEAPTDHNGSSGEDDDENKDDENKDDDSKEGGR
ncbi:MAG: amidohydrolase family protein [bacterium]|nr:amidohydrolase family protein [bacterium]